MVWMQMLPKRRFWELSLMGIRNLHSSGAGARRLMTTSLMSGIS